MTSPVLHSPVPVIIGLDPRAMTSLGIFQARENTSDLRPPILMKVSGHSCRLDPLVPY